jgi:hypothetical protein
VVRRRAAAAADVCMDCRQWRPPKVPFPRLHQQEVVCPHDEQSALVQQGLLDYMLVEYSGDLVVRPWPKRLSHQQLGEEIELVPEAEA